MNLRRLRPKLCCAAGKDPASTARRMRSKHSFDSRDTAHRQQLGLSWQTAAGRVLPLDCLIRGNEEENRRCAHDQHQSHSRDCRKTLLYLSKRSIRLPITQPSSLSSLSRLNRRQFLLDCQVICLQHSVRVFLQAVCAFLRSNRGTESTIVRMNRQHRSDTQCTRSSLKTTQEES